MATSWRDLGGWTSFLSSSLMRRLSIHVWPCIASDSLPPHGRTRPGFRTPRSEFPLYQTAKTSRQGNQSDWTAERNEADAGDWVTAAHAPFLTAVAPGA